MHRRFLLLFGRRETVISPVTGNSEYTGFEVTGQVDISGFIEYARAMATATDPRAGLPTGHGNDVAASAPGDLELVRSFVSLHDHAPGTTNSLPPSAPTLRTWFRDHGLVQGDLGPVDLGRAAGAREDLRALVAENMGLPRNEKALDRLDRLARAAGVTPSLARGTLEPHEGGLAGALGRLLAIAFLARTDGSWDRLRTCSNASCHSVFYDRSKNRSGRWCDMRSCGTQAKVRAYRARQRAADA